MLEMNEYILNFVVAYQKNCKIYLRTAVYAALNSMNAPAHDKIEPPSFIQ